MAAYVAPKVSERHAPARCLRQVALSPPYLVVATIVILGMPNKIVKFLFVSNYFTASVQANEII